MDNIPTSIRKIVEALVPLAIIALGVYIGINTNEGFFVLMTMVIAVIFSVLTWKMKVINLRHQYRMQLVEKLENREIERELFKITKEDTE